MNSKTNEYLIDLVMNRRIELSDMRIGLDKGTPEGYALDKKIEAELAQTREVITELRNNRFMYVSTL